MSTVRSWSVVTLFLSIATAVLAVMPEMPKPSEIESAWTAVRIGFVLSLNLFRGIASAIWGAAPVAPAVVLFAGLATAAIWGICQRYGGK